VPVDCAESIIGRVKKSMKANLSITFYFGSALTKVIPTLAMRCPGLGHPMHHFIEWF